MAVWLAFAVPADAPVPDERSSLDGVPDAGGGNPPGPPMPDRPVPVAPPADPSWPLADWICNRLAMSSRDKVVVPQRAAVLPDGPLAPPLPPA